MEEINFVTVNTQDLWEKGRTDDLSIVDGGLELSSTYVYKFRSAVSNLDIDENDPAITDIAVDKCDLIYIIAYIKDKGQKKYFIYTYDQSSGSVEKLGCKPGILPVNLESPTAISIDKDTMYIADNGSRQGNSATKPRIIALAQSNYQTRWIISEYPYLFSWEDVPGNDNGILIEFLMQKFSIDWLKTAKIEKIGDGKTIRVTTEKKSLSLRLNSEKTKVNLEIDDGRKDEFPVKIEKGKLNIYEHPKGTPLNQLYDLKIGADGEIYVLEAERVLKINRSGTKIIPIGGKLTQPTDIAVDKDGDVYVLDKILDKNYIRIFCKDGTEKKPIQVDFSPKGLAIDAKKQIFVGEALDSILKDKTIYKLGLGGIPDPLWSYRSTTKRLINDSKDNLYVIDGEGKELTFLDYTKVNLYKNGSFSGTYTSMPIDSHDFKNRWHRFHIEGKFPEGTQIEFSYYISDELRKPVDITWTKGMPAGSSVQGTKIRDALFRDNIQGRYLWFRIRLTGNETLSPVVSSIAIFFPRKSYLDYLPAIYQEDPVSKEFLERFLSVFESVFSEIDFNIDHINRFFDAFGAPQEFLSWLESWLAISVDESFSENMKRLYIHKAISLYKKRGTREGLEDAIAFFLYTKKHQDQGLDDIIAHYQDEKPFIVENFLIDNLPLKTEESICRKMFWFSWDGILENNSGQLIEFLKQNYGIDWIKTAKIEKIDDDKTIRMYTAKNSLLLRLNDEKTKVNLKIDDDRADEFIVKNENGKLNVYWKINLFFPSSKAQIKNSDGKVRALSEVLFGKKAFGFCVFLGDANLSDDVLDTVRKLIEEQKPAHTCYGLKVLEPWFYLDMHTYLGVNTVLTKPVFILGRTSVISRDTVLGDVEQAGQIRRHSRIGMDTRLT